MRVLITGGAGFIGSHLTERMLAEGHQIMVLDDLSTGWIENLRPAFDYSEFEFVEGSVLDTSLVGRLVEQSEVVIHGLSSPIVRVPYAQAYPEGGFEDMRRRVPCICKIARLTGWEPHTTIDEMITHTIRYERRILSRPPPAALTLLPEPALTV